MDVKYIVDIIHDLSSVARDLVLMAVIWDWMRNLEETQSILSFLQKSRCPWRSSHPAGSLQGLELPVRTEN